MSCPIRPLILCGGAGTRLWPMSRESYPKQFALRVGGYSIFQQTLLRVSGPEFGRPLIITNQAYRFIAEQQLAEIDILADFVLEPARRDTAPAIVAAAAVAGQLDPDVPLLVLASDHQVRDGEAFRTAVLAGLPAAKAGWLVTFGIRPTDPATGYGYIEAGEMLANGARAVRRFVEKPDAERARHYVMDGLLWNSGNFMASARTLLEEYALHQPTSSAAVTLAAERAKASPGVVALDAAAYAEAEQLSIDYAIMERTVRAAVVPLACGWSDVGNWDLLWSVSDQDGAGNVSRGEVVLSDAQRCYVSSDGPLTSVHGVEDLIVIVNKDAILVTDRHRSGEVKQIVEGLRRTGRQEADTHCKVYRPWGWYQVTDFGDDFQVKRIVVNPKGRLSLQKHGHRAEHWVVVRGTAQVTVGDKVSLLTPNEHAHIPLGAVHRLENPGNTPVELVEVQCGDYLGEDDIVRLEDIYQRA
ncbi:mannose-1-phosphate guanylyltransferase/mannose-6-phosphate isomerase [Bosea rubneri]|uniref:mannose-1-phosphate guanylyltransferase n=1 Tax=Bosea rubneri TaxID=3075434 RepID=A0ABU3S0Q6_9HYPH|nr:mannose-1-phosphate guanylyltransferase/mannose-6-phosphate isomerase [Bosea sp. ZW T0_25]MDU0338368.1 mannose-1-phosphate guanylyltransferase/mannose-6-phosphate isomerase [Bosea sp. ZW T0_25]